MSPETPASPRRSPAPVVIALLLAGALILALGYGVGKRSEHAAAPTAEAPAGLRILAPQSGDSTAGPTLRLVFRTDAPLELTPRGWLAGSWHVHAMVDGQPTMAAAPDIQALGGNRFAWSLTLSAGDHEVQLRWADLRHTMVAAGASAAVRIHVGPG